MPDATGLEMDYAASHVVYVDERMSSRLDGQSIFKLPSDLRDTRKESSKENWEERNPECLKAIHGEIEEIRLSLRSLLSIFDGGENRHSWNITFGDIGMPILTHLPLVYLCISGHSCLNRIWDLEQDQRDQRPLLVFVGINIDEELEDLPSQTTEETSPTSASVRSKGLSLLRNISRQLSDSTLSKRIISLAMIYDSDFTPAIHETSRPGSRPSSGAYKSKLGKPSQLERKSSAKGLQLGINEIIKYVDIGAVEVVSSPLTVERLNSLVSHAYRAYEDAPRENAEILRQKKARKLSWLGNKDERPFAYLREKM